MVMRLLVCELLLIVLVMLVVLSMLQVLLLLLRLVLLMLVLLVLLLLLMLLVRHGGATTGIALSVTRVGTVAVGGTLLRLSVAAASAIALLARPASHRADLCTRGFK